MKIFFDARYIRTDYHDGISRYSTELGKALASLTPVTFLIHDKAQITFLPENSQCLIIHPPTSIKEFSAANILNRYKPDVVFSPMQTMGASRRKFKLILTLHDMIYYRHRTPPRNLSYFIRLAWRLYHLTYLPQRLTLNGADMIATVSKTSKNDILRAKLTRRPVIVVPNAPQNLHAFYPKPVVLRKTSPKNLIYMGSFMRYKDVETLIDGMKWLPGRTLHLLSRISPARKSELRKRIPKDVKIIFHSGVSDEQYAKLLADDAIMVSASHDEGYGIPLADALEFGTPAVVSDLPIFHEVAGKGALYFKVGNAKSFATAIQKLDSLAARKKLAEEGKRHISQYDWKKSARILLSSIETL